MPGPAGSADRRYIDGYFKENPSLDQPAHRNKYYPVHAFRREFGGSPINRLISRRIEESSSLLQETDYTLPLIARIWEFPFLSHFFRRFRRVERISPMEYRRQNR